MQLTQHQLQIRIKRCLVLLIIGLALSGLTAFPIESELSIAVNHSSVFSPNMQQWLNTIYNAVKHTNEVYPYLSYGTDWLAFAHLVLAVLFVGPWRNPVKNIWVIEFGIIACIAILPLAFIAGSIRHIPIFWRLIDCSFGLLGILPLFVAYRYTKILINRKTATHN